MSLDTWQRQKHAFGLLKKCMRNEQSFAESNTASTVETAGEVSSRFASAFADSIRNRAGVVTSDCEQRIDPSRFARNRF